MPDPGIAPLPPIPAGQRDLQILASGGASTTQLVDYQNQKNEVLRAGGVQPGDIERYWGRTAAPSPAVQDAVSAHLTRSAATNNGNLDFLTDPVGSFSAMMGIDPKGVKQTLDAVADNFTNPAVSAWHGLEAQQSQNWQHALNPTVTDQVAPGPMAAVRAGATLYAAGGVVFSPLVGAIKTVGAPAGRAMGQAGVPLPHVDVDLKSPGSNIADPTQWKFDLRAATKAEAGQGYGDILTGVGAIVAGEGLVRGGPGVKPEASLPTMPENMRALAVDAMRRGEITNPADILQHGMDRSAITPAMQVTIPRGQDFVVSAQRLLPPGTSSDAVLRVTKNLQDAWASTGVRPEEAMRRAMTDGAYREEIVGQNIAGDPVMPQTNAAAPKPPMAFGQKPATPAAEAAPKPKGPDFSRHAPAAQATFVNSVDESMAMMQSLEGSPDLKGKPQVSRTGAVGRFQIEPSTARQYGLDPNQLSDPTYNAHAARVIVTDLYRRFNGNMEAMAIAYNDGPGRARSWLNQGVGSRLEAVRDNAQRGGWRYVKVAADRDETFLPRETQEYVARTRFKMGKGGEEAIKGAGGETGPDDYTPPPHAEVPADVEARQALDDETKAAAEQKAQEQRDEITTHAEEEPEGEKLTSGSIGAARVWDDAPVEQAYDEIGASIGQQDEAPVRGMSMYDRAITAIASRLQPAKVVDDLRKNLSGGAYNPEKEFSLLDAFRQAAHSDDRAKVAMGFNYAGVERGGVLVRDGDKGVKVMPDTATARGAFQQAIKDGGNPDSFMKWLIARRALALDSIGKDTPFNLMAAARIANDPAEAAKYTKAAAIWDEFTKGVREYAKASGRYSQAQIDGMEAADLGTWISFNRVTGQTVGVSRRGFTIGSPVKGLKGSVNGMVGDPLSNSLDNVNAMFRAADNNAATGKLISMVEADPQLAATLGIRKDRIAGAPDLTAVEKEMKALGLPEEQWEASHDAIATLMSERDKMGDNEFAYYRDGQKEVWTAAIPELIDMMKGATPIQAGGIIKLAQTIAHGVSGAVTALPDFAVKMFASHQLVQFINHPDSPIPFATGLHGLAKLMGADGMLEDVMANGGLGSSMRELDRDNHYDTMTSVLGETGWLDRVRNDIGNYKQAPSLAAAKQLGGTAILTPFRMMRAITERLDIGNRIGLSEAGKARGYDPLKAGAQASEYGIDYTNRGAAATVNMWSSMVPFMRAGLLYSEQGLKAVERNPAAYALSAAVAVSLPKMLLYGLNMIADDIPDGAPGAIPERDKYRNIPAWERLYFFITPPIAGQRLKLRMPDFAAYPFGALPEAAMMAMHEHNPAGFKDMITTFIHDFVPPLAPPAVQVPAEVATNTNLQTWQPLVSSSLSGAVGELQYTHATSEPAKAVARVLGPPMRAMDMGKGVSPIALDHIVQGWTDGPGTMILNALGAASGHPEPPMDIAKLPFASAFLLAHPEGGRAIDDFYAEKDKFDAWAASKTTLRHEVEAGDTSNLQGLGPDAVRFAAADARLKGVTVAMAKMRDAIYGIDQNKAYSDDEKRQHTNQILDQQMIPLAKAWTGAMRQAEEGKNPSAVANPQPSSDKFGF